MQPPIKPWENGAVNSYSAQSMSSPRSVIPGFSPMLYSSAPASSMQRITTPLGQVTTQQPPALPRRVLSNPNSNQSSAYRQNYSPMYGSPLGGMGYGGYGGYGSYGGMGSYGYGSGYGNYGGFNSYGGYGMNRYATPNPNDPESRFIQLAEESSRPAFQSIESLVQAFHSVSMMLDSTFNAVHTSFRAVLGVAENFGRLRTLFAQFFSSIALFRAFVWLYKKVLFLLGLRRDCPASDQVWQQAVQAAGENIASTSGRPRSSWPILMFMGIVFSGPYLIFKLMSSLSSSAEASQAVPKQSTWDPKSMPGSPTVGLYDFYARSDDELSFLAGQPLTLAPSSVQQKDANGWLLARLDSTGQIGLVPYNYIRAVKRSVGPAVVPSSVPLTEEQEVAPFTSIQQPLDDPSSNIENGRDLENTLSFPETHEGQSVVPSIDSLHREDV